MFFPEDEPGITQAPTKPTKVELVLCACRECQCHARTPHASKVCYLCRGGQGTAYVPFPPAHRPQPRKSYPKGASGA